ncbi:MAG: M48 family metallopeptidase [Gammaproteobacteria bacterium]|nr:M48 family metallopeptidase [Gammaproteobacteria bacterium]
MNYQIIRSKRKTLSLQINQNAELIIRAPLRLPEKDIQAFVVEKSSWISKKQEEVESRVSQKYHFEDGEMFLYLGNTYPLAISLGTNSLSFNGEVFELNVNCADASTAFRGWYKLKFRDIAVPRIDYFANKYSLQFHDVRLKAQKTLWGSCSSDNNLNFNYLLMMAPMSVIDYVIVHELSHTIHKNHSSDFWGLVEAILPEYKQAKKWLKENGHKLRCL